MKFLAEAFAAAEGGQGRTIVITGGTGMGKTVLVEQALAALEGWQVFSGRAYRVEQDLPYGAFAEALSPYFLAAPRLELSTVLGSAGTVLAWAVPALAERFPLPSSRLDPQTEKIRLWAAAQHLFVHLSGIRPVALWIDDAYWADDNSVELLHYLARNLARARCLLLLGIHPDEVSARPEMMAMLASLRRLGVLDEIQLGPLTPADTGRLVQKVMGTDQPPSIEFVDWLYSHTLGNPFFAGEMVKAQIATGGIFQADGQWRRRRLVELQVPPSIADAIQLRLARLESEARSCLEALAIHGADLSHSVLVAATGLPAEILESVIAELARNRLIQEATGPEPRGEGGPETAYRLAHPLVGATILQQLSPPERRAWHARLARCLIAFSSDGENKALDRNVEAIARHYTGAGELLDQVTGRTYIRRAADRAMHLCAYTQAAHLYQAVLNQLPEQDPQRLTILPSLAEALSRAGLVQDSARILEEGSRLAKGLGDREAWTAFRRSLAMERYFQGEVREMTEEVAGLLPLLDQSAPTAEVAHVYESLSMAHSLRGRLADAGITASKAVELAHAAGDPEVEAWAWNAFGLAFSLGGEFAAADQALERALTLVQQHGLTWIYGPTLSHQAFNLWVAGKLAEAAAKLSESAQIETASADLTWSALVRSQQLVVALDRGQLDVLHQIAEQEPPGGEQILWNQVPALAAIAAGRAAMGFTEEAVGLCRKALEAVERLGTDEVMYHSLTYRLVGRAYLEQGNWAAARGYARRAADRAEQAGYDVLRLTALVILAEATIRAGLPADGLATSREVSELADHFGHAPAQAAAQHMAGLALAAGQSEMALEQLGEAIRRYDALSYSYEAARARYDLGLIQQALGQSKAVTTWLEAEAIFEQLRASRWLDRVRKALRGAGVRRSGSTSPGRHATGLSERELEVLTLAARGKTREEIAAALFISENTVNTHLSRIYTRLSLRRREELVAYAMQHGLL